MKYYTGLNELLAPPAVKVSDAAIINEDRFKTSSTSVHSGRQPDTFIPREQKAPGHWKVNYVDAKQYDFSVRQEEMPVRSVTGFEFRDPRSRTSFPVYVSPEVTDKGKGMRVPFSGLSETKQQFRRKTGVHSFEKPVSRYTHAPERLEQMPRLQNRTISNLSPNVVKPIITIPTTARVYHWQLKEPVAVRQTEHLKIDKHFDRDSWAVPGRYRTSYEAHGQVPETGDAMKFPAAYN